MKPSLSGNELEALRHMDACTLANAIETFRARLRNEGFTDGPVRCLFPRLPPMVGYRRDGQDSRFRPADGGGHYQDRTDWWDYILSVPRAAGGCGAGRGHHPGLGSLVGAVHMNILRALGCVGAVTNGAVRDLPEAEALGFQLYAGHVSVSHAYVHIVEFGLPVEIDGLKIQSGDLLHGDLHGAQLVPLDLVARIPEAAARIVEKEAGADRTLPVRRTSHSKNSAPRVAKEHP